MIQVNSIKVVTEYVNTETGEVFVDERVLGEETKKAKRASSSSKKVKDDGSSEPHLTLLDNKYQFNEAAMNLTGFQAEDRIAIKFEKKGRVTTPVVLLDEKEGNRLTKTNTVSCRGKNREELLKFGQVFTLEQHPSISAAFILKGDAPEQEDDIIDIPEEIVSDDVLDASFAADINGDDDNIDFEF